MTRRLLIDPRRAADLELAWPVLAELLRDEYPADLSLAAIARTWRPHVDDAAIRALERLEATYRPNVADASSTSSER